MAESTSTSPPDITITVKGPSELKLSITISPSKTVSDLKEAITAQSQVEKDRQRLIYSGKVLKDEELISLYKIQNGHTIHMVKGAAKPATPTPAAGSSTPAGAPRLPQMGTGLNVAGNIGDSIENYHHGMAGFNPFNEMQGINNLNDPNAMTQMMQNPEFLRSMSEMMSRPEVVDQIIAANPQLASMGPQIRQMMSNPMVRQMMSNPESLRMMMQMQAAMGEGGGAGGMGGMGGFGGMGGMFGGGAGGGAGAAAPAATNEPFPNLFAPQAAAAPATPAPTAPGATPSTGAPPANPFAALFGPGGMGGAGAGAGGNPFGGIDPALLFGAGGAGGLGGGMGGWGAPAAAPRDTRPPEEIYATQLGQLNAMGLWDAQKNIRALRSTGGNVEAAIELIFSGQMDQPGA